MNTGIGGVDESVYITTSIVITRIDATHEQCVPRVASEGFSSHMPSHGGADMSIDPSSLNVEISGGLRSLVLLASVREDSMFLRYRLLSALVKHPFSKVDAMKLLSISRPYLDRILNDWMAIGMIEVRDDSPEHILRPRMTIYLVRRPVLSITKLDGHAERIEELADIRAVTSALLSKTRQAILASFGDGEKTLTPKELGERIHREDIYRHIRTLLKSGLLLKLRTPPEKQRKKRPGVLLRRNYMLIRFSLESHAYGEEQ